MNSASGVIVFARSSSQRLPGKVLLDFGGMPLVLWVLRRAQQLDLPLLLATSTDAGDDALADCVQAAGYRVFRGSLDDVLQRAIDAAQHAGFLSFARLCADRPFFDLSEMRLALDCIQADEQLDLVSNNVAGTALPGLTTEAVRLAALQRAAALSQAPGHREHLTSVLYQRAASFRIQAISPTALPPTASIKRFAVDTWDDYQTLRRLATDPAAELADLLAVTA